MLHYKRTSGATGAPPVPPQRHSSIRANAPTPPIIASNPTLNSSSNSNQSVSRLVIDLETKFGKRFHNVTEFPKPPPFLNIQKIYPSRTVKATNAPTNEDNNNVSTTSTVTTAAITTPNANIAIVPLQPAYQPFKKHRAPAPPPQAGVAAATVSVIRQSSFLYGGQKQQTGVGQPRNSTIY